VARLIDTFCFVIMCIILAAVLAKCNAADQSAKSIDECIHQANKEMHQCIDAATGVIGE